MLKVTGRHPLSARSPQIRYRRNQAEENEFGSRSDARKREDKDAAVSTRDTDYPPTSKPSKSNLSSQRRRQSTPGVIEQEEKVDALVTAGDLMPATENIAERTTDLVNTKKHSYTEDISASLSSPKSLLVATSSAGAGTFVSSMPSLTKLQSSFTARELALFTRRLNTSDQETSSQTRYHVASHPHSTSPVRETLQTKRTSKEDHNTHKRALSSSTSGGVDDLLVGEERQVNLSSWRQIDTSINHIYEDPSIDMVQFHLLHSHHTVSGQKKRKMVERERVLAAASGLREHQSEEKRRQEELLQRRSRMQQMSEAIRLQNQRAIRTRGVHAVSFADGHRKRDRQSNSAPTLPARKPPVPRLSGNNGSSARQQSSKRRMKQKDAGPQGGVSASILMGVALSGSNTPNEGNIAKPQERVTTSPTGEDQGVKRRPPTTISRTSLQKKKKQDPTAKPTENDAAIRAKQERRAIAREYMQLQKHSRRVWIAKAKEQSQREHEKRQQQLEILEATRLNNLRLSKKRRQERKKQEIADLVVTDEEFAVTPVTRATISNSDVTLSKPEVHTPTKYGHLTEMSMGHQEPDFDEPDIADENYNAIGNQITLAHSLSYVPFITNSSSKSDNVTGALEEQSTDTGERVRKLLELKEKAAALSSRLSGLRNRKSSLDAVEGDNRSFAIKPNDRNPNDGIHFPDLEDVHDRSTNNVVAGLKEYEHDVEKDHTSDVIRDDSAKERSEDVANMDSQSESESDAVRGADQMEGAQHGSTVEENDDNAETESLVEMDQATQQSRSFDVASGINEEEVDFDVRSIGVYNISVVWPIDQEDGSNADIRASNYRSQSSGSIAVSSSQSSQSSDISSPRLSRRKETTASLGDSRYQPNETSEERDDYEQISALNHTETNGHAAFNWRSAKNEDIGSDSGGNEDSSPARISPRKKSLYAEAVARSRKYQSESSKPSPGLMRLIRETDDSLSVIDRAAKKLYQEQCERSEREMEKKLQIRMEAEKKELLEKDMALQAVMASLTSARSDSVSEDDEEETCMQAVQYKQLEEIMDEVEKERSQEKEESNDTKDLAPQSIEQGRSSELDQSLANHQISDTNEMTSIYLPPSSPAFWDRLVSDPACTHVDDSRGHIHFNRPHIKIDDSELIAQRETQLRENEEHTSSHIDSPLRVHSPRTLSKRLMAAVDYQETIFEAHMQLSMMEHAHELETVQAETITLAQAFKEEMEQNVATHQLALDHVTLEKKFDGDIHDVIQQLDAIRQVEEQEKVANEVRMEQELRAANLRECSAQTDAPRQADAATCAVFSVDTSTSPVRFAVDAAVQYDLSIVKREKSATTVVLNDGVGYSSIEGEDPYRETFENESHIQVDVQAHDKDRISEAPSIAESILDSSQPSEAGEESDIPSEISHAKASKDDDQFEELGVASSIADEESIAANSISPSAIESAVLDEVNYKGSYRDDNDGMSASIDYEDDFEASSPKMKAVRGQADSVEDEVLDELELSEKFSNKNDANSNRESDSIAVEEKEFGSVNSNIYSSQLEDTSHGKLRKGTKSVVNRPTQQILYQNGNGNDHEVPDGGLALDSSQTPKGLASGYILDLERRKKAEESLLNLRLQTVQERFDHEVKQLDKAIELKHSHTRAVHELKMRKETLRMAFLAEKANVESLKAASIARYYQDLHAFRSLSLDWPHAVARSSHTANLDLHEATNVPPLAFIASSSKPVSPKDEPSNSISSADDYSDEFASHESDHPGRNERIATTHKSIELEKTLFFVASEHSDVHSSTSDLRRASEEIEEEAQNDQLNASDMSENVSEEEQYEEEFISMSENVVDQHVKSIVNADVESRVQEQVESGSVSTDGVKYDDDDFISVSESTQVEEGPDKTEYPSLASQSGGEILEQDIKEDTEITDNSEVPSDKEIEENDTALEGYHEEEHSVISSQHNYSDDAFESGQIEQRQAPYSAHILDEQSISVREEQSTSEDSSTTKLLVAEIGTLQAATTKTHTGHATTENEKVAKKKAKTEELLQAKEQLLIQQKEAFRREEEKRHVDAIAKMALGVDVEGELRRAKADITQQLASEFDALKQAYPMLCVTSRLDENGTTASDTTQPHDSAFNLRKEAVPVSSVMSKLFGKNRASTTEDGYSEDYEAESFEGDEDDVHGKNKASPSEQFDKIDGDTAEVKLDDRLRNDEVESEDLDYDIASEVPSDHSDIEEDGISSVHVEEEEDANKQEMSDGKEATNSDENDYENDYENESFDEDQSTPQISREERSSHAEHHSIEESMEGKHTHKNDDHSEDEYSDEAFDSASGSSSKPDLYKIAFPTSTTHALVTSEVNARAIKSTEELSTNEETLTQAIQTVVAQLEVENLVENLDSEQTERNHATQSSIDEIKSLATSMSVSPSRDEEEESLTKSIEERNMRLQELREKIADRKREVIAVQKQIRVERRKELIAAEEKKLLDEMESVEKLLSADEAALALCRQRNRLEMMHLEARQYDTGKKAGFERGKDLMLGFDYVEAAQITEQARRILNDPLSRVHSKEDHTRGFDLLGGYVYVEVAEPMHYHVDVHVVPPAAVDDNVLGEISFTCEYKVNDTPNDKVVDEDSRSERESYEKIVENEGWHEQLNNSQMNGDFLESVSRREDYSEPGDNKDEDSSLVQPKGEIVPETEATAHDGYPLITQDEETSDLLTEEGAAAQQVNESIDLKMEQSRSPDLLADYAYVEVVDTNSDTHCELLNVDLLFDFDHVESAEAVDVLLIQSPTETDCNIEELRRTSPNFESSSASYNQPTEDAADADLANEDHCVINSQDDSTINPEAKASASGETHGSGSRLNELITEYSAQPDELASCDVPSSPSEKAKSSPDEVSGGSQEDGFVDRGFTYCVFATTLEISASATSRREVTEELETRMDTDPPFSAHDAATDLDVQFNEVGVENVDSTYTTDWSIEQSSESVTAASLRIPNKASFGSDEEPAEKQVIDGDEGSGSSIGGLRSDNTNSNREDIEPSEELYASEDQSDQSSVDSSMRGSRCNADISVDEPNTVALPNDVHVVSGRVADEIFAAVFDDVLASELQLWSHRRRFTPSPQMLPGSGAPYNEPVRTATPIATSRESAKRVLDQNIRVKDRDLTQKVVDRLEIVNGKLQLFTDESVSTSSAFRALCDTVEEIARDHFSSFQPSTLSECSVDILAIIQDRAKAEIDELLSIREQSEHELERQLQLLSDEYGAEDGLNGDVLLSQNCIASNVDSIVSKVQSDLTKTTAALPPAVQSTRPGILPRTPISRAKSTSILSSLQEQQDEELQQRITGMILDDLLRGC
ncbi:unnamed protein product [Phytophthora lilii]|uniref:Unnamed protein product n=1 Tax=Phytophthora lilii TaxID=2077276 RepID=A0A9W6TCX1_9STRA|nr:unnamed protein product [Phytophthora lilii]